MTIGVFDSGKGATYIADRLRTLLPEHKFIVADDSEHVPYGTRPQGEILELTDRAIQPLLKQSSMIVIACNTITAAIINILRKRYPHVQFIGLEPMVKPASTLTRAHHVVVLSTPYTIASTRYQRLKELYAGDIQIDEPSTAHWPRLIEDGKSEGIDLHRIVASYNRGADVVVLGCTHYLALIPRLKEKLPDVTILEPSEAIARRVAQLLAAR